MSIGTTPQLPLALRYPPDQRLATFVDAPPGALAQLQALATRVSTPDAGNALFLAGPGGVGKTHLALATCAAAEDAGHSASYLPLKSAVGRVREAVDACAGGLLALDGLEAIAGNRDDELALFDLHNRAIRDGTALLYTAQAAPDDVGLILPDLRSRLAQCARISLAPLSEGGRRDVLRARAQRRGLVLEEPALDWLLRRVDRDLASLTLLLDQLDRASLAAQRRITVPFLRELLGAG